MFLITKEEAMAVRSRFKDVCITRTVKNKNNRHRYYCEERPKVVNFVKKLRTVN